MKTTLLRFAALGIFALAFIGIAFASPLAHSNPNGAIAFAAVMVWASMALLSPARPGFLFAITVPNGLLLDKILNTAVKALARRLLPLSAFSTVYRDVVLSGTDQVQVPFIPLQQAASQNFAYADGYKTGDGVLQTRPIQINRRKYQALGITSYQLARQPILELEEILAAKANQLAEDIIADIFSQVTPANFPNIAYTGNPSGMDSNTLAAINKAVSDLQWPDEGRSLVVNTAVDMYLLEDNSIKNAMAFGDRNPIGEGKIPRILGFDYFKAPVLPNNGVNLTGFAALRYGLLTAFSPIPPTEAVKSVMVDYRQATHEATGLTLEYRLFGSAQGDVETHIIECNYGSGLGDIAQIAPIISQAQ